jgi:hypothetical protein
MSSRAAGNTQGPVGQQLFKAEKGRGPGAASRVCAQQGGRTAEAAN